MRALVNDALPGSDLVQQGLDHLALGKRSIEALLVLVGAPRLRALGLTVPVSVVTDPELAPYERLAESEPDSAHSRYNALVRTLVSFERARSVRRPLDLARLQQFMRELGQRAELPGRVSVVKVPQTRLTAGSVRGEPLQQLIEPWVRTKRIEPRPDP